MNIKTKELLDELLIGSKILVNEGVIDGFGHISVRSEENPDHYFMLRDNLNLPIAGEEDIMELDRDSNPVLTNNLRPSIERFIHGEIYRARPDVNCVVHTHAPALIPYGISSTPLKPVYHMCGFLHDTVPVFDIALEHGVTNMLVTDQSKGQSLIRALKKNSLVLMRGHGATLVGVSIKEAVYRSVYATLNAQMQSVAIHLENPKYLSPEEALKADELHGAVLYRPWEYWKNKLK